MNVLENKIIIWRQLFVEFCIELNLLISLSMDCGWYVIQNLEKSSLILLNFIFLYSEAVGMEVDNNETF